MGSSLGTVDIHRQIVQETELSCLACKQLSSTWMICKVKQQLPSGEHTKSNGKSPFLMGNSTINGHFQ